MEDSKDHLNQDELRLVTGGVSHSEILSGNQSDTSVSGADCAGQTCKKGCTPGCNSLKFEENDEKTQGRVFYIFRILFRQFFYLSLAKKRDFKERLTLSTHI